MIPRVSLAAALLLLSCGCAALSPSAPYDPAFDAALVELRQNASTFFTELADAAGTPERFDPAYRVLGDELTRLTERAALLPRNASTLQALDLVRQNLETFEALYRDGVTPAEVDAPPPRTVVRGDCRAGRCRHDRRVERAPVRAHAPDHRPHGPDDGRRPRPVHRRTGRPGGSPRGGEGGQRRRALRAPVRKPCRSDTRRGFEHFAQLDEEQVDAGIALTLDVCRRHGIEPSFFCPSTTYDFPRCFQVATIVCHSNCRADKTDLCLPEWVYEKIEAAGIRVVT